MQFQVDLSSKFLCHRGGGTPGGGSEKEGMRGKRLERPGRERERESQRGRKRETGLASEQANK